MTGQAGATPDQPTTSLADGERPVAAAPTTASFDVFDTVLTRRTGRPEAVLELVAARLDDAGRLLASRGAFVAARRRAEPRLHTLWGRPPRLPEVYAEVVRVLNLASSDVELFVATEQDVERQLSVAVPAAAAALAASRRDSPDGALVFVSDTPHSTEFLRELLEAQRLLEPADQVFTSADMGASKSRGGLFTAVAAELGLHPTRLLHTGDNARADVTAARAEQWRAKRRPQARLNRYEQLLEGRPQESEGFGTWLAGASRSARLRAEERAVEPAIASVAAGVVAPVLICYAVWLAGRARRRGLKRLYFVSRDGEIMLEVARPVLAVLAPEVDCRYLYGSRQAWVLAGVSTAPELLPGWLGPKPDSTLRTALTRAGLTPEGLAAAGAPAWMDPAQADRVLTAAAAERVSRELQREPLRTSVLAAADRQAELALAYLRQEGLADDEACALVDVGWRGHNARALDRLVDRIGGPRVDHLFVGLYTGAGPVRSGPGAPRLSAWLFDRDRGLAPDGRHLDRPNVVLEMFCAGVEGRLLRYRQDGARVAPVLAQERNTRVLNWGLADARQIVAEVVQECVPALNPQLFHADLASLAWDVLHAFWMTPTTEEARAWGTFPWEEESNPPIYPIAERLATLEIARRLVVRRGQVLPFNSWRAGAVQLQEQPWQSVLRVRSWSRRYTPGLMRLRRRAVAAGVRLRS